MARFHKSPEALEAARTWRNRCFLADGSVLSDHQLWTLGNLEHLDRHFVQNLETGEGTFFTKLEAQLAPAPSPAKQLAAEMLWLLYLSVSQESIKGLTKRMQIRQVWEWSGEPLPDSPMLGAPLEEGIANPGTGFQTNRWRELVFLIDLAREWKSLSRPDQEHTLADPWDFASWLDAQRGAEVRQFRHMLLYLLFPEHFERVVTGSHKELILKRFGKEIGLADGRIRDRTEVDRRLFELRPVLERQYGVEILDYYLAPVREDWLPANSSRRSTGVKTPATEGPESEKWSRERFGGTKIWVVAAGEGARLWTEFKQEGIVAIGSDFLGDLSTYRSYDAMYEAIRAEEGGNPINDARACWQFAHEMRPGDYVVAKQGRRTLLGYGVVTGEYLHDEGRSEYQHTRSVEWRRLGNWALPDGQTMVVKTLTDYTPYPLWLKTAFRVMDEHAPDFRTPEAPERDRAARPKPYTYEDALSEVFLLPEQLTGILDALARKKNVILEGAPGVGKTFVARRLAWAFLGQRDYQRVEMVQFHQSYAYEDFIQGWRPCASGGFDRQNGVFHRFCARARSDPENRYVFIIDEINRGNLAKVFGEVMMLIEADKRGPDFGIPLTYSPDERFDIPENVFVLGMMNTADRSLAMVDYALRRRFSFVRLRPAFENERFASYLIDDGVEEEVVQKIVTRMTDLNRVISEDTRNLGPGYEIGHSFFVPARDEEGRDDAWYQRIVRTEIEPLLHEYWFDQPDLVADQIGKLLA